MRVKQKGFVNPSFFAESENGRISAVPFRKHIAGKAAAGDQQQPDI
jgi:hypothetical protein